MDFVRGSYVVGAQEGAVGHFSGGGRGEGGGCEVGERVWKVRCGRWVRMLW